MKIEFINNYYLIYLNKYNIIDIDFNNTKVLEHNLKSLLKRLNNFYHMNIKGYYNIDVYIDDNYGVVLRIEENNDYYDYFDDMCAIKMKKIKTGFLYEVEDISFVYDIIDRFKIIKKNNKIYLIIKDKLNYNKYLELLEMSKIVLNN